jgi:hypothetical protein
MATAGWAGPTAEHGFDAATGGFDFSTLCIVGYALRLSRRGPDLGWRGQGGGGVLPVPEQRVCAYAKGTVIKLRVPFRR